MPEEDSISLEAEALPDPIPPETPAEEPIPMLDVHPPHEPVHGWRDFLLHLATITIGLLIALSLEATVEYFHHRHLVTEARENIRHEMTTNRKQLSINLRALHSDKQQMERDMDTLRALRNDPKMKGSFTLAWSWSSFSSSAWQTARDTGALSYMPLQQVQQYADVYTQQSFVNEQATLLIRNFTEAEVPLLIENPPAVFTPSQIDEALHRCAQTYVELRTLEDVIAGLDRNYNEALQIP
jgi:hypothetical protein